LRITSRLSEVGVANLGKFLQGIFRIIAVKFPDERSEESATWSRRSREVEFELKCCAIVKEARLGSEF